MGTTRLLTTATTLTFPSRGSLAAIMASRPSLMRFGGPWRLPAVADSAKPFFERNYFLFRRLHSLSGIVPIGVFLISHLLTNSSVVWGLTDSRKAETGHAGVATFQHEVDFIHSIPFLLIIEVSLWGAIAFHSIFGVF